MRKVLLLFFNLLVFCACDINFLRLKLINDTENTVYYLLYTDTVPCTNKYYRKLYPHETFMPGFLWENAYKDHSWVNKINKYSIDSALHIFVFQTDKITDELIKNKEYERLSFTVKELDSLNWTVVYSGQEKIEENIR